MTQTTYIFIDSANIIYGAKETGGWKVDFHKLHSYLTQKYKAVKIFYYTGYHINLPKDDFKLQDLSKIGYIVRAKPLKFIHQTPQTVKTTCPKCKFYWPNTFSRPPIAKANCDVDLTQDALIEIKNFQKAVFMSGDGDFLSLYQYLESQKKEIGIISESKITAQAVKKHFKSKFSDLLSIKNIIQKK